MKFPEPPPKHGFSVWERAFVRYGLPAIFALVVILALLHVAADGRL